MDNIAMRHDQLTGVFDGKQPLLRWDKLDERFREGRLPEPVAPLTRMFLRAGTATLKNSGQSPASRRATNRASTSVRPLALARVIRNSPAPARWSIGRVRVDGLRIVKEGQPLGVTDGMTIWQRSRSEEHTSELQSLMRTSYAVFCLKKKTQSPSSCNTHHLSFSP